jgi:hypothetical protein
VDRYSSSHGMQTRCWPLLTRVHYQHHNLHSWYCA